MRTMVAKALRRSKCLPSLLATFSLLSLLLNAILLSSMNDVEVVQKLTEFVSANADIITRNTSTKTVYASKTEAPGGKELIPPSVPISACLLIKDDNAILNEWIAYHYHVLGLRLILVAVDPSSIESPTSLFQHWERITLEMGDPLTVVEWSDVNFMPPEFLKRGYYVSPEFISGDAKRSKWHEGHEDEATVIADNLLVSNHRFRQATFLSSCLRYMRNHNRTWTVHIDTDEYVVINPFLLRQAMRFNSLFIPKNLSQASTVMEVLQGVLSDTRLRRQANFPCISMPRLLFGSVEDEMPARVHNHMLGFNANRLETLRWKYHTSYNDTERNAQPKVIIDVSQSPRNDEMFQRKPFSIHRPSKALCRRIDQLDFKTPGRFPLSVNHYLGTWERYYARNDTRRSARAYNFKANVSDARDEWITSWVLGFMERVGSQRAMDLLFGP
jgi:hypothetical protein